MLAITSWLNAQQIASPKGVAWGKPTVRKFLDNLHYAGLLRHEGGVRKGNWEPIVSMQLWDEVQRRRLAITNRGVCPTGGLYLLSGLIECGVCGATLYHRTKQDRVPGQHVCRGTENLGYCEGGGIAEHRAEAFIVGAYLERYGSSLVHDPFVSDGPVPAQVYWQQANLQQRRTMLAAALQRVVLIPRPSGNPRGTGLPRGRQLEMSWAVHEAGDVSRILLGAPSGQLDAKVCERCGRRRHISNFRLDPAQPDGRTARCARCRADEPTVLLDAEEPRRRMSHQEEWRRFLDASRDRRNHTLATSCGPIGRARWSLTAFGNAGATSLMIPSDTEV